MITVVNKHTHIPSDNDFYIGRGSALGNPYTSIQGYQTKAQFVCASPEESIGNFHQYILEKIAQKDKIICDELNKIWKHANSGKDVNLICYCAPKPCHGTIVKSIIEEKLNIHKTYTGKLLNLDKNQIAIVGTNTQGRHGKGFALLCCQNFGLTYGKARGYIGRCYAIITKDLTKKIHPSRTPEEIKQEIFEMYEFAKLHSELELVCPYNCSEKNLNFYSSQEMADFFGAFEIPKNIIFEKNFYKLIKKI